MSQPPLVAAPLLYHRLAARISSHRCGEYCLASPAGQLLNWLQMRVYAASLRSAVPLKVTWLGVGVGVGVGVGLGLGLGLG